MTVLISDLEPVVRSLVGDFSSTGRDIFTYTNSAVFTLTEENIVTVDDVLVNDVSSGVSSSYSTTKNQVTIASALTNGDTVEVQYTFYSNWSSAEIEQYIRAALAHLSVNQYKELLADPTTDQIHPEPDPKDQNIIAVVASILLKPDNKSIRLPDLTINAPRDLPTDQKISRAISICKKAVCGVFSLS